MRRGDRVRRLIGSHETQRLVGVVWGNGQTMSERDGRHERHEQQREQRAPYLYDVGRQGDEATVPRPEDDSGTRAVVDDARKAEAFSQALMYACVSWVALVREETAQSVELTPIGQLLYEADVLLERGERVLLRVGLQVEPGLVVRTVVEPVRPS